MYMYNGLSSELNYIVSTFVHNVDCSNTKYTHLQFGKNIEHCLENSVQYIIVRS